MGTSLSAQGYYEGWEICQLHDQWRLTDAFYGIKDGQYSPLYRRRSDLLTWIDGRENTQAKYDPDDQSPRPIGV